MVRSVPGPEYFSAWKRWPFSHSVRSRSFALCASQFATAPSLSTREAEKIASASFAIATSSGSSGKTCFAQEVLDGEIAINWALDGHVILMRAEWDIERYLESGRLVQVLPGFRTPDADIYAVYPQRHQLSARIRTFVDFLAESFERFE